MFSLHVDTGRSWRGGQSQVFNTVTGLRAAGHRAVLVAHPAGELFRRMREGHDLLPLAPKSDVDLSAAWSFSRLLKRLRPHIVHAHDAHAVSMAATALAMAGDSRPALVATRRAEFRIALNSFSRWKYSQVDRFIATCDALRHRLIADGIPRDRIAIVHDGVDVDRIARLEPASVHAAFYLPVGSPVVGNVGALAAHKGHRHLVDAAVLVRRELPDARFVIVGDGDQRTSLERHIRDAGLERHVFLAGFRADVLEMIGGFDLFAAAPLHEGMCLPLVDAMAAGKAAVATRAGGIPEVMVDGTTGFLVEPRDHRAMAERIVQLLRDERLRARLGAAAQARAREHFSIIRMVEGTAAVYDAVSTMRNRSRSAAR